MTSLTAANPLRRAVDLLRSGRLAEAETLAHQILAADHKAGDALSLMGLIEYERGRFEAAGQWHRKAIAANRRSPLFVCNLATTYVARGRLRDALAQYERALKIKPDFIEAVTGKADVLERRGRPERAGQVLAPLIKSGTLTSRGATIHLRLLQRQERHEDAIDFVASQLQRTDLRSDHRRTLLLGLGRAKDKLGDCDGAFAAYQDANAIDARPLDLDAVKAKTETLMKVFSPEAMKALPSATHGSRLPVFIVGLPRCGSTLVEQIIHTHREAHGAGEIHDLARLLTIMPERIGSDRPYPQCVSELTPNNLDDLAKAHLDRLKRYSRKAHRIVDKSLINFERLGIITLLLPGASIIHVRRHPLDQCFSCFMEDLPPQLHPYSTDLTNLGLYYLEYARLMQFWREHPAITMLEVDYEDLVADQERVTRQIIEFLDLEWDDRLLRFHEAKRDVGTISYDQVRKPIYTTAIARYRRYEKHLAPLMDALGDVPAG